jgi:hypothetical protein
MLKNSTYDLMEVATVISKGLHRYDTFHRDSKDCAECQRIWSYMQRTDEEQLRMVLAHLKSHFQGEVDVKLAS